MEDFYKEQTESSRKKCAIVSEYFSAWAMIMARQRHVNKLAYIDLFCGPGKYEDGNESTPLKILKEVLNENSKLDIKDRLVTLLNDCDGRYVEILKNELERIPGINNMRYPPVVENTTIDEEVAKSIGKIKKIPSLFFIDPFGYKGLTLSLIETAISDWGCDCIFFFNYNRINAALSNPVFDDNINQIFGVDAANELRLKIESLDPEKREEVILLKFMEVLKTVKGQYALPFKFYQYDKTKTSHFLILVTKNILGYNVMKEIMAKHSDKQDGIPKFEFNPSPEPNTQYSLFDGFFGINDLGMELLVDFAGQRLSVLKIFELHNVGKPYLLRNYKTALLRLEAEGKIETEPPQQKRPKRLGSITMSDKVIISFK